jgi:hypothetical protein
MTLPLQADTSSLIEKASDLAQSSYLFIKPCLEIDEEDLYVNEQQYIKEFPFSYYQLISVPSQGDFYINDKNDTIKNYLRNGRCWEPRNQAIIAHYVKPGSIALDIGAHIGTHGCDSGVSVTHSR